MWIIDLTEPVYPDSPPLPVQGYNAAIIAYGQTGTGKTFTMVTSKGGRGALGLVGNGENPPQSLHRRVRCRAKSRHHPAPPKP